MVALLLVAVAWFPSDNVWRHQISTAPLSPLSSYWAGAFFPFSRGFAVNPDGRCGLPINRTGPGWQRMKFDYAAESDTVLYPFGYEYPAELCGVDSHYVAVDTTSSRLFEIYDIHAIGGFSAGAGATWDLSSDALRPNGWTSASESGMPLGPGVLRYEEARAGSIRHAIGFALSWPNVANSYVWPARHVAFVQGSNPNGIPLGTRMRVSSRFQIPAYTSAEVATIIRAMQDYGLFLVDRAGDASGEFSLEAEPDPRWNSLLAELTAKTRGIGAYLEFVDESKFMADPNSGRWRTTHWWWPF